MLGFALATVPGCATRPGAEALQKADSSLRTLVAAYPDSLVSVLVRTSRVVSQADRAALEQAGLSVRSVLGDVVTGDLRARHTARAAALSFVIKLEAAREMQPTPLQE